MAHPNSRLVAELGEFLEQATDLWGQYLSLGPGKVDSALFDALDQTATRLSALLVMISQADIAGKVGIDDSGGLPELADSIQTLLQLAERCARSPQGLSFVTGEAGLIPNKQEHDEFERQLANLAQVRDQLRRDA